MRSVLFLVSMILGGCVAMSMGCAVNKGDYKIHLRTKYDLIDFRLEAKQIENT